MSERIPVERVKAARRYLRDQIIAKHEPGQGLSTMLDALDDLSGPSVVAIHDFYVVMTAEK